ncbi:MAG: hypothetical protein JWM90_1840, partial [Thermoleophilia bacterium]|nr:hypothetical protein [Thermoleophilia bacterium]
MKAISTGTGLKTTAAPVVKQPLAKSSVATTTTATRDARAAATVVKQPATFRSPTPTSTTSNARAGAATVLAARATSARKEVRAALLEPAVAKAAPVDTKTDPADTPTTPASTQGKTPSAPAIDQAALQTQQDALGAAFTPGATAESRAQAEAYFATHDTYIDPTSGIEYAADYDPATGTLELERTDVSVAPQHVPGWSDPRLETPLAEPGTPLDAAAPPAIANKGDAVAASKAPTPATGKQASLDALAKSLAVEGVVGAATGRRMGVEEALAAKLTAGDALIGVKSRGDLGGVGAVKFGAATTAAANATSRQDPAAMDELIVIMMDGDRVTARAYVVTQGASGELTVTEHVESTYDGTVTGGQVDSTSTFEGPAGTERFQSTETFGQGGVITGRERDVVTTTPDGAVTSESGSAAFTAGAPTASRTELQYRFGTVTATESTTTSYEDGLATSAVIEQHALDTSDTEWWIFGQEEESARIVLTYDADGMVTAVDGPAATDQQTSLTAVVADHPTAAGETFAFTQIRQAPGEINGLTTPALVSGPGIVVHDGPVAIFQEGGRAGQSGPDAQQLADIRSYLTAAPAALREPLTNIDLLDGRNPLDAYWEATYDMEDFSSAAIGGNGRITFLGNGSGEHVFYHELGHVWGVEGGAPDDAAWAAAIADDAGIDDTFAAQGEVVENEGVLIDDTDGVSGYADQSYTSSGSESEDWADSVQLWL